MPRRRRRPPISVTLVLPAEPPTPDEIDAILMAADAIIDQAGRSGLTLILNGSRSKKALEWEWDQLPDYGALRHLTADQITRKVDWCIHHKWLRLEHNRDGIPLIYHSQRGWERVELLWVERLLGWFEEWQAAEQPERVWPRLETIDRDIKLMLLEAIEERERCDLVPVLRAWFPHEVRAVRKAINHTLQSLGQRGLAHPPRTTAN
ncbi:MAG: RQC-minor-1 family DNA-binding protein [Anaerolineae bacterium]|nr:RQC-minor-1 family DNA-binding protein [Anaerolineae bacterium]